MGTPHHVLLACGSDWQAPVRLPRLFQRAGCHVTVLASRDWGITKTRFIDEILSAPTDLPSYVDALRAHVVTSRRKYGWIVAIDDPLLEALVRRKDEAWTERLLPLSAISPYVSLLADKASLAQLGGELELPMPHSIVCDSLEDGIVAARANGYPLVVKLSSSYAGMGVRKVESESELVLAWQALHADRRVVLQSFVEGQLGNTAVLFSAGRPLASMSSYKSRTWPGAFGPSCARQFVHHEKIEQLLMSFGARTSYDGFCAFDWIRNAQDDFRVIEMNARPVPALHMAMHIGVDFAKSIGEFLDARSMPDAGPPKLHRPAAMQNQAIFPMFPEDFQRAIAAADHEGLAQFLPGAIGHGDIPWDDPPFLAHVLRRRATRRAFERLFPNERVAEKIETVLSGAESIGQRC